MLKAGSRGSTDWATGPYFAHVCSRNKLKIGFLHSRISESVSSAKPFSFITVPFWLEEHTAAIVCLFGFFSPLSEGNTAYTDIAW